MRIFGVNNFTFSNKVNSPLAPLNKGVISFGFVEPQRYNGYERACDPKKLRNIDIEIERRKNDVKDLVKEKDVYGILNYFGFNPVEDKNGDITIDCYLCPGSLYGFHDLGIEENMLFEKIKHIKGNLISRNSYLTNLGSLKTVGGNLNISHSNINDLGNLKEVGGNADFSYSDVKSLGNLEKVRGSLWLEDSDVHDLGALKYVGGNFHYGGKVESLKNLEYIAGIGYFRGAEKINLAKLKQINDIDFSHSELKPSDFKNVHINNVKTITYTLPKNIDSDVANDLQTKVQDFIDDYLKNN